MKAGLDGASARMWYSLLPWTEDLPDFICQGSRANRCVPGSATQIVMDNFAETLG